jgi:hypothetical protein
MLRLPLTSVLLTTLFVASDGVALMPLVIVAVVVAYVTSAHLAPRESQGTNEPQPADAASEALSPSAVPTA